MILRKKISLLLGMFAVLSFSVFSQTGNTRDNALKIYIDCKFCDTDYIKRNIKFVNYVTEQEEAEVYVMFVEQKAGNEGIEYNLIFTGQKRFKGKNDTLRFVSLPDNTFYEVRKRQVKYLKMGLLFYAAHTEFADLMDVSYRKESGVNDYITEDKWNSWVFRLNLKTLLNGESNYFKFNLWSNIRAEQITPDKKLIFQFRSRYSLSRFGPQDDPDYKGTVEVYNGYVNYVKSLTPNWSAGIKIYAGNSTYNNYDINLRILPATEYNIFPYEKSSVKQFTFRFETGCEYNDYSDTTIYDKLTEFSLLSRLSAAYKIKEKWGNINTSLSYLTYWQDLSKYNLNLNSSLDIRIIKGLSVTFSGRWSLVRSQINLKKEGASYEETLLRQQQVATDYSYGMSAGLTYTFGSVYNNVVNPRFDSW